MTHESGTLEADAVRGMFDRIAPVYDTMNRVMTAGLDGRWRRLAVTKVVWPGDRVLDACCGTGDLAIEAERRGGRVVGLDFSERMLERARRKSGTIEWVQGDALVVAVRGRGVRRGHGRLRRAEPRGPRARAGRARPGPPPGGQARGARDHPPSRHPATVLPPVVRRARAARRQDPARREGVHVPPRERPALPRPGGPVPPSRERRLLRGGLPAARRRQRRAAHGSASE